MSTEKTLKVQPVKEFMGERNFVSVHKTVRENANGYPYVTFIDKDNKAENIYFSKSESDKHQAGNEIAKGFFDKLQIAETENAEGEKRMKLVGTGSLRVTVEDLF